MCYRSPKLMENIKTKAYINHTSVTISGIHSDSGVRKLGCHLFQRSIVDGVIVIFGCKTSQQYQICNYSRYRLNRSSSKVDNQIVKNSTLLNSLNDYGINILDRSRNLHILHNLWQTSLTNTICFWVMCIINNSNRRWPAFNVNLLELTVKIKFLFTVQKPAASTLGASFAWR